MPDCDTAAMADKPDEREWNTESRPGGDSVNVREAFAMCRGMTARMESFVDSLRARLEPALASVESVPVDPHGSPPNLGRSPLARDLCDLASDLECIGDAVMRLIDRTDLGAE